MLCDSSDILICGIEIFAFAKFSPFNQITPFIVVSCIIKCFCMERIILYV